MAGSVFGIFPWPGEPQKIVVVPNIKRSIWLAKFNLAKSVLKAEQPANFKGWQKFRRYVETEAAKEGIEIPHMAKQDKLGLPGGEIWDWEIKQYPKDFAYAHLAIVREFTEETGLVVSNPSKDLFEHILMLPSPNHNDKTKIYENHFFLIRGVFGELILNKCGVEEETGPPEIWPITELNLDNFYPKHAYGLKVCLDKLLGDGRQEYILAVNHLESEFGAAWDKMLKNYKSAAAQKTHAKETKEKAETWEDFINQKGVKPLQK